MGAQQDHISVSGAARGKHGVIGSEGYACLQVYISYGQKTSGQLLLSYGFMPALGSNPHDACLLELSLAEDDPCYQAKAACLSQYGAEPAREFPLRLDALPQALLLFAAFRDARPSDAAEVMALAKQLFEKVGHGGQHIDAFCKPDPVADCAPPILLNWQMQRVRQLRVCREMAVHIAVQVQSLKAVHLQGTFPVLHGCSLELAAVDAVLHACRAALARFSSSDESDRDALQQLQSQSSGHNSDALTWRRISILQLRIQERRVLNRTVSVLIGQRRQLSQFRQVASQ